MPENNNSKQALSASSQQQIPYGRQNITENDLQAVHDALLSDYLTQGPKIAEFEKEFAQYVGAKYAVAVSNGTAALHLNALALDVKPGDKVITSPITFAASANCVRYCGGEVVFADIDPNTFLLDINKVREILKKDINQEIKGIIPVDFAGRAVDLEAFRNLANEYGLWIIEDSCHSPGGFFVDSKGDRQYCGSGKFADLAIFSFHPVKHIASGEGGMMTTNNEELYKKLLALRTHGIVKQDDLYTNSAEFATGVVGETNYPGWYMEMQVLGYNYRITDFQSALGLSQLKRAGQGILRRHEIAARYHQAFKNIPQITDRNFESANSQPLAANGPSPIVNSHAHHLYVLEVDNRLGLYNFLRVNKVFAQIHYVPCHLMPYYRELGWKEGDMPNAEKYYKHCISLPMFPTLSDEEQNYVIDKIKSFYND